jgi:hypothetical protein
MPATKNIKTAKKKKKLLPLKIFILDTNAVSIFPKNTVINHRLITVLFIDRGAWV